MSVNVVQPRPVDRDLLEQMLGEPPLRVERVNSPSISLTAGTTQPRRTGSIASTSGDR
jgi:hypothetical protein